MVHLAVEKYTKLFVPLDGRYLDETNDMKRLFKWLNILSSDEANKILNENFNTFWLFNCIISMIGVHIWIFKQYEHLSSVSSETLKLLTLDYKCKDKY